MTHCNQILKRKGQREVCTSSKEKEANIIESSFAMPSSKLLKEDLPGRRQGDGYSDC